MSKTNKNDRMPMPAGYAGDVLLFDKNIDEISSPLLTLSELAKLLKISPSGVRRLQQQRSIPFLKVGGSVRFLKEDIRSYLSERRVKIINNR